MRKILVLLVFSIFLFGCTQSQPNFSGDNQVGEQDELDYSFGSPETASGLIYRLNQLLPKNKNVVVEYDVTTNLEGGVTRAAFYLDSLGLSDRTTFWGTDFVKERDSDISHSYYYTQDIFQIYSAPDHETHCVTYMWSDSYFSPDAENDTGNKQLPGAFNVQNEVINGEQYCFEESESPMVHFNVPNLTVYPHSSFFVNEGQSIEFDQNRIILGQSVYCVKTKQTNPLSKVFKLHCYTAQGLPVYLEQTLENGTTIKQVATRIDSVNVDSFAPPPKRNS